MELYFWFGLEPQQALQPSHRSQLKTREWNEYQRPDLSEHQGKYRQTDMSGCATNDEPFEPATLFRAMQTAIGAGLKERYAPPRKMSHQLFVLMMQMNDRARRERAQAEQGKTKAIKANADKRRDGLPAV
jgi:hypothetical protein